VRRVPRALALLLAGAVGLGCGVRKALPSDGAAEASAPETEVPAPDAGVELPLADAGAELGPSDAPKLRACASDGPSRVALVTGQDDKVIYVMSDGSSRVVYRFPTDHKVYPSTSVYPAAGGDIFAIWTLFGPTDQEQCEVIDGLGNCPEEDRLVRLDLAGHVLWEKQVSGRSSSASIGRAGRNELAAVLPPAPPAPGPTWQTAADGDAVVRTNLVTGESDRIVFTYPNGLRPLGPYSLDHEGSFARVLRDDTIASAYLSRDGTAWTPLGKTLTDVEEGNVRDVAGTYVISVQGTTSFFNPKQVWSPVPDGGTTGELRWDSVQVLRPSAGLASRAMPDLWIGMTSDGLCAAYIEQASGKFVLHDLARDARKQIVGAHAGGNASLAMLD
jgi:hypothetical protein